MKNNKKIILLILALLVVAFLVFIFLSPKKKPFWGYLIWKREGIVFINGKDMVYDLPSTDKQIWVEETAALDDFYAKLDVPDKDNAFIKVLVAGDGRLYESDNNKFGGTPGYNSKMKISHIDYYLLFPDDASLTNVSCQEKDQKFCRVDEDCICTQEWGCFLGNKNYYFKCADKYPFCDDGCGMSSDAVTRCVDNQCKIVYEYD